MDDTTAGMCFQVEIKLLSGGNFIFMLRTAKPRLKRGEVVEMARVAYKFCFVVAQQTRRPPLAARFAKHALLRSSTLDESKAVCFLRLQM